MLTCALAQTSTPPMGANIMPTINRSGRTVLGVRMGLEHQGQHAICQETGVQALDELLRMRPTATPLTSAAGTLCLYQIVSITPRIHTHHPASLLAPPGRLPCSFEGCSGYCGRTWWSSALHLLLRVLRIRILPLYRARSVGDLCFRHDLSISRSIRSGLSE